MIVALFVLGIFWSVARDDYSSDYSLLNWAPPKRLELVHIARTGGLEMAMEAAKYGYSWGACHFGEACPSHRNRWTPSTPTFHQCLWQHVPSQYFDSLLEEKQNPYHGGDRFVVVRNVYDRIISEYYLMRKEVLDGQKITHFNEWVQQTLLMLTKRKRGDMAAREIGNQEYFTRRGHLIPQYDYVYENETKVVQHVLRYENLPFEFDKLMEQYHLPMRLAPLEHPEKRELTVYNLTKVNLMGIEMLFEDDFREFGYEIMSSRLPDSELTQTQHALAKEIRNYKPPPPKKPIPDHWIDRNHKNGEAGKTGRLRGARRRVES